MENIACEFQSLKGISDTISELIDAMLPDFDDIPDLFGIDFDFA